MFTVTMQIVFKIMKYNRDHNHNSLSEFRNHYLKALDTQDKMFNSHRESDRHFQSKGSDSIKEKRTTNLAISYYRY